MLPGIDPTTAVLAILLLLVVAGAITKLVSVLWFGAKRDYHQALMRELPRGDDE